MTEDDRGCSCWLYIFCFFNDTAPPGIYPLSLHAALPIFSLDSTMRSSVTVGPPLDLLVYGTDELRVSRYRRFLAKDRSEEHTSELQSRQYLVCRLLLEKKKTDSRLCLSSS